MKGKKSCIVQSGGENPGKRALKEGVFRIGEKYRALHSY